jgi:type IV fimbrial biogenesis protein FimT
LDGDGVSDCPAVIQSRAGTEGTRNVQVNPVGGVATVAFTGLGRAGNTLTLNITNPTGGACKSTGGEMRCLNIIVATGGQIRMCNPALASTNPQGC